jgi:hypothetical protein
MTTNAEAVAALVTAKAALQGECNNTATGTDVFNNLTSAIHAISAEIGALEAATLTSAAYVPATDLFKQATANAKSFVASLNRLRSVFDGIHKVAGALDSVISLITKHSL